MRLCATVIALLACTEGFIIPEEFPSLLSLVYSNIPPIKKGTDSRVGLGFRLGPHADFQVLLELGPQTHTDSLGSATPENTAKREVLVMKNAKSIVDYVNSLKEYFGGSDRAKPGKVRPGKTGQGDKMAVSDTAGGHWIEWWRDNLLTQKEIGKIQFNKVPGIDDRVGRVEPSTPRPTTETPEFVDHLRRLYREQDVE